MATVAMGQGSAKSSSLMPPATGRRLAELLPDASYVEIPDARTLIPFDNPAALTAELRRFVKENPLPGGPEATGFRSGTEKRGCRPRA
jgi:hypothetical protein